MREQINKLQQFVAIYLKLGNYLIKYRNKLLIHKHSFFSSLFHVWIFIYLLFYLFL